MIESQFSRSYDYSGACIDIRTDSTALVAALLLQYSARGAPRQTAARETRVVRWIQRHLSEAPLTFLCLEVRAHREGETQSVFEELLSR